MDHEKIKVLFLSPEVAPLVKTGGLADVAGALPQALKRLGVDIRLVLPFYRSVRVKESKIKPILERMEVSYGDQKRSARVFETHLGENVPCYLMEQKAYYDRAGIYGDDRGDFEDNLARYAFFCHGALQLMERLSYSPTWIHCHDWQAGLVPALLKGPYREISLFARTRSLFTIHNLGYQGLFPASSMPLTGLSGPDFFHPEGMEYWGNLSLLKAGLVYADLISTVSPTYAREILTPEQGMGMEGILSQRRAALHGILNGVDYGVWDPSLDAYLPARYSALEPAGKERCKKVLIREMGLDPALSGIPLLGMVSRLDAQKGLDLLMKILLDIPTLGVGLVILGAGDENVERALKEASKTLAGRMAVVTGFNEPLAHRILAGADIFLIPSRYEPCGLTQMYALKYGTMPLVRATGGLEDTVVSFDRDTKEGNGVKFGSYDPEAFLSAIRQALTLYEDRETWKRLMLNGMKADFSWDRSAERYLALFKS